MAVNLLFWIWLGLGAVFIIGEIFTLGFFLFWFGLGAGAAAVLAMLGFGIAWQLIAFMGIGFVGVLLSRRFAARIQGGEDIAIGVERFVGQKAYVMKRLDKKAGTGRVRVEREEWKASPEGSEPIEEGEVVEVLEVDGNHLIVRLASSS